MKKSCDIIKPMDWSKLKFFSSTEFRRPHLMDEVFIVVLDQIREDAGFPFVINSSHRNEAENKAAGGVKDSAHMEVPCRCVDIHVDNSWQKFQLVDSALEHGIERIFLYPTHVHLDSSPTLPRPRLK